MITWLIIGTTAAVSFLAFQNVALMEKLQFNAAQIVHRKQYYRLISHAFVHVSWTHLIVNMLVLFFFGRNVENYFSYFFGNKGEFYFVILYLGGMLVSNVWSLIKHQNDYYYNAVGASGAVSAVLFTFIFLDPWEKLYLFAIIPIPGIVFGVGYLIYSYQMSKRKMDNVAHDAHFLGAVFGFVFPIILNPELFKRFIELLPNF
ncbi:rhomboid family intramembrane serine protease [Mariniphaga sediminis]|jgi:membrane associated rhomboid family serine protease|uniref:Rhomboid family intramembrane serine protease n=1 Tax=Mariniphaga sediminis TaxID=1628158 RepID=A0A399D154_9BACT|nr:rhomboid family intramembrane serine protease [Mariniphaga sediminis]RIH65166.1 rhomboid family intramembrane serine protease [Mariniphaga sediminis]